MTEGVLVLGGGGHAKVIADILQKRNVEVIGFLDDDPSTWATNRLGISVLGPIDAWSRHGSVGLIVGIGSNAARCAVVQRLSAVEASCWHSAIDPAASISRSASFGVGLVIMAGAVILPDAVVGSHVIINACASVSHDCRVGNFAHIGAGARLNGGARVGEGVLVGTNAVVIPGKSVGDWTTIGAGSVVIEDVPPYCTAVGVPARVVKHHS